MMIKVCMSLSADFKKRVRESYRPELNVGQNYISINITIIHFRAFDRDNVIRMHGQLSIGKVLKIISAHIDTAYLIDVEYDNLMDISNLPFSSRPPAPDKPLPLFYTMLHK